MTRQRTQQAILDSFSHFDWDEHHQRMQENLARLSAALDRCNAVESEIEQANRDLIRDLSEHIRRMG